MAQKNHSALVIDNVFSFRLTVRMASSNPEVCSDSVRLMYPGSLQSAGHYRTMGALMDGLCSHIPGGRLIKTICNKYCGHNYKRRY